jgi:hypothetical protein
MVLLVHHPQTLAVKQTPVLSSVTARVLQLLQQTLQDMVLLVYHPQTPAVKQIPVLFNVTARVLQLFRPT